MEIEGKCKVMIGDIRLLELRLKEKTLDEMQL
jgi:hypothetical protein